MTLLQKLLMHRNEVIVLYEKWALCSCGARFDDYSDAENHLVQSHEKVGEDENHFDDGDLSLVVDKIVAKLSGCRAKVVEKQPVEVPERCIAVCPDEADLKSGHVRDAVCFECGIVEPNFDRLKLHFLSMHPRAWPSPDTAGRLVVGRKPKQRLPKSWAYLYFCPLPGCLYHVLHTPDGRRSFANVNLLRQHYAKSHAHRSIPCPTCDQAFATEVYLRRHIKSSCGKSFSCLTCKKIFGGVEALQTHCRRKGHGLATGKTGEIRRTKAKKKISPPIHQPTRPNTISRFVKIAPLPSSHHMSAAIALSELSTLKATQPSDIDMIPARAIQPASGAQTSSKTDALLASSRRAPRLVDIEQFSTETQTDDLENILLKPASAELGLGGLTIEAQTQFDLDDILCSNYTQTADLLAASGSGLVNSAETQTMFDVIGSDDVDDDVNTFVHMETQTTPHHFSIFD